MLHIWVKLEGAAQSAALWARLVRLMRVGSVWGGAGKGRAGRPQVWDSLQVALQAAAGGRV